MSRVNVKTREKRFAAAPSLYGLFYEDINRSGDGGLYPEMLRNRSFEDSILPERCKLSEDGVNLVTPKGFSGEFNNGEGRSEWMKDIPYTPIPAWYADNAGISLDSSDTLNPKRLASLRIDFSAGGSIHNVGYCGMAFQKGHSYVFYMFAKSEEVPVELRVSIVSEKGAAQDETVFSVQPGEYQRYSCTFTAAEDDFKGRLIIVSKDAGAIKIGFSSLMPAETYKGHGLRKDLMEMLTGINAKFLRFPGGCIVEGFTRETAMRFSKTIGPVWERPSHLQIWHYRSSNGLGYHEYLQMCEDLSCEPMYVVNCGHTCQAREAELFEGEELEAMIQEALDAIEYAIGDQTTPMGQKRAEAGHPEPFRMKYVEIGNENWGPEYNSRYKMFYDALKSRYPKIKYIANVHIELEGFPTDIVDEHYYDTPEFFIENINKYDDYNRHGPDIFVGEYAVTGGGKTGTLRCALAEAMFLLGIENNQDIVTLTAYAPLFQNVNYPTWFPDLIAFDNHRCYGIPSYHVLAMLGENRGADVVASSVEESRQPLPTIAAAAATENNKIIIKIVNIKAETDSMEIILDRPVNPDYEAKILTGNGPDDENSLNDPLAVSPKTKTLTDAAPKFVYEAPPYSLNILTLKLF